MIFYLAMTAAELGEPLPEHLAYMACHFSPYATGLSNLPQSLPPGSMVMVNDRTPIAGHDPAVIACQLKDLVAELAVDSIVLDFQRPEYPETAALVKALAQSPPCPMAVSSLYALPELPVFLPPVPPDTTPEAYLAPWAQEVWLEVGREGVLLTVTEDGTVRSALSAQAGPLPHEDEELLCHYSTQVCEDAIRFSLRRTDTDLRALLERAAALGVSRAVGLFQELGSSLIGTV